MNAVLNELLKQTSRSFYLTLCVLPAAVRPQIGLAYLLARRFHRPSRTNSFNEFVPDTLCLANIQCRFATKIVPEGQLEISQPQGGWCVRQKDNPSRRDGGNLCTTSRFGHFHRPFRTNKFPCYHQGRRPWLISGVAPRPNIVPKAQPEISQPQGGWYRGDKFHPSRRDGGNIRASFQSGNLHRPFRTNKFPCCHQGRRPWLISGVAPRPNIVPKAQLEISQTRSVWLWWKRKFVLKGRWKFPNRVAARMLPSSRWDGFNCVERYQTLRVWLISGVAPRPNFTK